MPKPRANELSAAGRRGRNSKARGHAAERALAKLLSMGYGLPVKRIARSGALKAQAEQMAGNANQYRGDLTLDLPDKSFRIEVKTRSMLPQYVKRCRDILDYDAVEINQSVYVMTLDKFIGALKTKDTLCILTGQEKTIKALEDWFAQDDSDVVIMRQTGEHTWYVAVYPDKLKEIRAGYNKYVNG